MFSGIIEERIRVKKILRTHQGYKLTLESAVVSKDAKIGDSISVNGVCLTVINVSGNKISFDVMEETLRRTALAKISAGDAVNLENALKAGDKISGHFVTGHVDCVGKIRAITKRAGDCAMDIEFPADRKMYLAEKGSVAIDGVSLTVSEIKADYLRVHLIPLTLKTTNLGLKKRGDPVNIEFDILSKYSIQTPPKKKKNEINAGFLKEHGFL